MNISADGKKEEIAYTGKEVDAETGKEVLLYSKDQNADAPEDIDHHRHTRFNAMARTAKARNSPPPNAKKIRSAMPKPPALLSRQQTIVGHKRAMRESRFRISRA